MATLDIHIDVPAHHHRQNSRTAFDRQKDHARFIFNKTIAGHYRHGRTEYTRVGVLLITWDQDDMNLKNRLQTIFKDRLRYETQDFQIPSTKSETSFHHAVSSFVNAYNSPDNLMIVYYGGHGYKGTETNQFKLAAKEEADGDGDPNAFFNDMFGCLRLPTTDILFIVDCCYAARAFALEGIGRRKFELMASAPPDGFVPSAKNKDSFTQRLCDTLEEMLDTERHAKGFPTSELYRRIYHQTKPDIKPFLFDQSSFDYGKIWLRPHHQPAGPTSSVKRPKVTIDLTLHMTDAPSPAEMNDLARALQYIPHVDKITLEELHAPALELQEFFYGMKKAMHVKKIIHELRQRINAKKTEQGSNPSGHVIEPHSSIRVPDVSDQGQAYDWSKAEAFLIPGTKSPVIMATGKKAVGSPHVKHSTEEPPAYEVHYLYKYFAFAWSLDLSGIKDRISDIRYKYPSVLSSRHRESGASEEMPKELDARGQGRNFPSVVFAAMADHEKRMQTLDTFMWLSTILVGYVILSHVLAEK
ncbi:MAG: hypothetical protein Q9187_005758 [Circinaria calcarea]